MVGEVIGERYELEELVGTGGMSSVYRATDTLLERPVALKILHDYFGADAETIERFRREARAAAQLSHPNIVTVIDRGEDEGRQFIVFEYVHGETLKQLIERAGRLPVRVAVGVALEVARGLAFAHRHGLVHRDVKPQNVLLNGDGHAKVTDFGIARSLEVEHGMTQTGAVLGTSNYIAPEQASGAPVDAQTDVYSLGVVLFELLTGEVPFPGENFVAVALRHINEPPPNVLELRPDVPARVANVVERALAKDPRERFPSMGHFVAELEECLAELGPEAADDATLIVPSPVVRESRPHPEYTPRARRRATWPLALLAALLAVAIVAAGAYVLAGGSPREESPRAAPPKPIELRGVASHDPHGPDRQEHDEDVALAADGNPGTWWPTETYYGGFEKPGVGLVLDAGGNVQPRQFLVVTDTPGFTAEIQSGDAQDGSFRRVSASKVVGERTVFRIEQAAPARYYVVWITELERVAHVNEVTARN